DSTPGINITKNEFITYGEGLVVKNCSFSIFHNNHFKNEKYDYCLSFKYFSTNCIISSNTFKIMSGSCGGIFFDWISNITIENNLFLYLVHESSYSNALYCSLGENLTINNNIFQGEFQFAINLNIMKNIVLSNNIIQNSYRGIYCGGAIHGNIFGNSITNNYQYGLELGGCNFINITFNEFTQQTIFAIQITYYGNSSFIFNNNFLGNNINGSSSAFHQAYDEVGITWFNPDTRLGNYWDDLEWYEECTYEIDGNMTSDLYPLQYPVTI
ncbi:MAG: NosD domain-containing protein, partial [Candidatus Thorarchaeota archaeon]